MRWQWNLLHISVNYESGEAQKLQVPSTEGLQQALFKILLLKAYIIYIIQPHTHTRTYT